MQLFAHLVLLWGLFGTWLAILTNSGQQVPLNLELSATRQSFRLRQHFFVHLCSFTAVTQPLVDRDLLLELFNSTQKRALTDY